MTDVAVQLPEGSTDARRPGWNAITFNYRGSWGSPGVLAGHSMGGWVTVLTTAHQHEWMFSTAYDGLAHIPMLVVTSNDGLAPQK